MSSSPADKLPDPSRPPILFWLYCAECNAKIKIRHANLIGARVPCPVCKTSIRVKPPADYVPPSNTSTKPASSNESERTGRSEKSKASDRNPERTASRSSIRSGQRSSSPSTSSARRLKATGPLDDLICQAPLASLPPLAPPVQASSFNNWKIPVITAGIVLVLGFNIVLGLSLLSGGKKRSAEPSISAVPPTTSTASGADHPGPGTNHTALRPATPSTASGTAAPSISAPPISGSAVVSAANSSAITNPSPAVTSPPTGAPSSVPSVAAAATTPASGRGLTRDIIDRVGNGIVLITTFDSNGVKTGLGSGFAIDSNGRIATNFHVVESAARAVAQFKDGQQTEIAEYWLADKSRDLAVLQLKKPPSTMSIVPLATTAEPQQGDDVIAIGHPKGFNFSVSTGIVSAVRTPKDLPQETQDWLEAADDSVWIQTTAPISPGNSGGPLLNSQGEVIGINTWVSLGGENLAFANHVRMLKDALQTIPSSPLPLPVPGAKPSVDKLVAEVMQRFVNDYQKYLRQLKSAGSLVERGRLAANTPVSQYVDELYKLADAHRREKVAVEALAAAIELMAIEKSTSGREGKSQESLKLVNARLLEDHLADEKLGDVAIVMLKLRPQDCLDFLEKLSNDSTHREVKGLALFSLAIQRGAAADGNKSAEGRAIILLKRVAKEYGDVPLGDASLKEIVEPILKEYEIVMAAGRGDRQGNDRRFPTARIYGGRSGRELPRGRLKPIGS